MAFLDVSIQVNRDQLAILERKMAGVASGMPRVLTRALNKVARKQRTAIVRFLAARTGLKQKDLRDRNVKLKSANFRELAASIRIVGKGIPVIRLHARGPEPSRGRGHGVRYRDPTVGDVLLRHAFIATMPGGHRGVFQRKGQTRLPIREEISVSVVRLFEPELPNVIKQVEYDLLLEIETQAKLILEQS